MPQVSQNFDNFSEDYDYWKRKTFDQSRYQYIIDKIPKYCNRILDVGCGTGSLSILLSRHSKSVTGIDNSKVMISRANDKKVLERRTNVDFVLADIENLSVSEAQYDIIVSFFTLHHTDLYSSLVKLKRGLSAGGQLFIKDLICDNKDQWNSSKKYHIFRALKASKNMLFKYGIIATFKILRFRTSSSWISHLMGDQVLTEDATREICMSVLPESNFVKTDMEYSLYYQAPTSKL